MLFRVILLLLTIILLFLFYFFFFREIILIFSCSRMFRNVQCSGFYPDARHLDPLLRFPNFDIIPPLIKSVYFLQEHVK